MSKVWLVHPIDKQDTSSANQFGEFVYINHRFIYADQILPDLSINSSFLDHMWCAALDFDTDEDYLLMAGDHLQVAQMCVYLGQVWGRFNVLRYDRIAKGYFPVRMDEAPQE